MVSSSCLYCSLYRNALTINPVNDKLASVPRTLNKSSDSLSPTFKSHFYNLTPGLALVPTPSPAPTVARYTDEDLHRATNHALEFFCQGLNYV